jgi:serine protease
MTQIDRYSVIKRFFCSFVCLGIIVSFLLSDLCPTSLSLSQVSIAQRLATGQTSDLNRDTGSTSAGIFDSVILDFQETPQVLSELPATLTSLSQRFQLKPLLNSEFSQSDHIYVMPGDRRLLSSLQNSVLAAQTEFIEPNYVYSQSGFLINDPDYEKQWNLRQIKIEEAWRRGAKGRGVTVAVIDTGISRGPDLAKTEFVPGYDFVNNRPKAQDDNGHGTHVAGTIAQSTNNRYGVAGVAYEAKLMPLKVLSRGGSGTVADIAEAIRFAADKGAQVINMSLGGGGDSKLMREAIEYAHQKGVVIVAAAGNEGRAQASYPALYPHVIAVSAIGPDQQKTAYSNYGEGVDIAAPGGATRTSEQDGILQETINPRDPRQFQFKYLQGTSMASPHVAGVAALVKARRWSLSADEVWNLLKASAQPVKGDSQNYYGAGYLDAEKAVKMASPFSIGWNWISLDFQDIGLKLGVAAILAALLIPRHRALNPWNLAFFGGILVGSIGLFIFRMVELPFLPNWPLRLLGSAIPELGGAIWDDPILNPLFASYLMPFCLLVLLISHQSLKWFALGTAIGVMAFLAVAAFNQPHLWLLGSGRLAQIYLLVNLAIGYLLTVLFFRVALDDAS